MYKPSNQVKDMEVARELQEIGRELNDPLATRILVSAVAPERPRQGDIRVADGINWNPLGAGVPRLVWFNGTTWVALNV